MIAQSFLYISNSEWNRKGRTFRPNSNALSHLSERDQCCLTDWPTDFEWHWLRFYEPCDDGAIAYHVPRGTYTVNLHITRTISLCHEKLRLCLTNNLWRIIDVVLRDDDKIISQVTCASYVKKNAALHELVCILFSILYCILNSLGNTLGAHQSTLHCVT